PVDGGLINAQHFCCGARAALAGYSQEVAQVVPVVHALVMQFCGLSAQACCSPARSRLDINAVGLEQLTRVARMRRQTIAILAFSGLALAPLGAPAQRGILPTRSDMTSGAGADPQRVNIIFAEGTGSFVVLLEIAKAQAFFGKRGIEVHTVPTRGATVPRLSGEAPLGLIGAPAALLQVAEGADLKLIATLSTTNLSGHLVAQPKIKVAADLHGKRLGVRVVGA